MVASAKCGPAMSDLGIILSELASRCSVIGNGVHFFVVLSCYNRWMSSHLELIFDAPAVTAMAGLVWRVGYVVVEPLRLLGYHNIRSMQLRHVEKRYEVSRIFKRCSCLPLRIFKRCSCQPLHDPVWCCYSPLRPLLTRCSWSMAEFAVDRCSSDRLAASDQWP